MTDGLLRTTIADVQSALQLPSGALVNQRVPKKLLAERGAPTPADRKLVQEHVEQVLWIAALKPANCGIGTFIDTVRDYPEASVLSLELRDAACASPKARRLAELVHRAIPYPVLLAVDDGATVALSLSHLRRAQDGTANTVLDGDHYWALFPPLSATSNASGVVARQQTLDALQVGRQAWASLWHLYQGWIEVLIAWQAAGLTGSFALPASAEQAAATREAVHRILEMNQRIESLRRSATKERQMAKLADINRSIRQLQRDIEVEQARISEPPQ